MKRTNKPLVLIVSTIAILPIILIGFYAFKARQYEQSFSQIKVGQNKQSVIDLMGEASEIRSCRFVVMDINKNYVGECFEIITYTLPYQRWSVAFDKDGKVLEKYQWFFGEYGPRPPDQLS